MIKSLQYGAKKGTQGQMRYLKAMALGVALFMFADYAYSRYDVYLQAEDSRYREEVSAKEFFEIFYLDIVPDGADSKIPNDPRVVTAREIKVDYPMQGKYKVFVESSNGSLLCYVENRPPSYKKSAKLPDDIRLVKWWMELNEEEARNKCIVWPWPAGEKCATTIWEHYPRDYPIKRTIEGPNCWIDNGVGNRID